ncbi:3'-5' exonuclease [Corynebacterium hindlerae]|uniref:exonuclease domain-containing protein n=1 Tax=Corynebacterium hindlerae TaxID=699041 RepID=UPI001AD76E5B|nr:exonuclease domain-containing protein [Corynebacterium hindlerae]QTH58957.1 3'-5' exonuclease [Corynebacterium hindlerae]
MRLFKPNPAVADLQLLAVDIETTGLKPGRDKILSIGWVPVNGDVIDLSGAGYFVISDTADVSSSVSIHGLTDDALAAGVPLSEVVPVFREALGERVMLAHYASIERDFLRHALGRSFKPDIVDTFALERRHMERMGTYPRGEDLRLPRIRARYELPNYRSHNALTDALACAELYLCLIKKYSLGSLSNLQP